MISRMLLTCGVAVPFLYFVSQIAAILLNPDYDILRQQPSELGCCNANLPAVANVGFIVTGLAAILAGAGLFVGLRGGKGHVIPALFAALCLVLFGAAMTMSGVFPLPNPLHYGFGLLLAGVLAPLFGGLALKNARTARWIVWTGFVASVIIVAFSLGVGGAVSEANVGLFSRALALVAFPTIAYLSWRVLQLPKSAN